MRAASNTFRAMATDAGEPPRTSFEPDRFAALLGDHRFTLVQDVGFQDVEPRYGLPALSIGGERITLATKT